MEAAKVKDEEAVIEIKDEEDGLSVETALESGMLTTQVSTNQSTVLHVICHITILTNPNTVLLIDNSGTNPIDLRHLEH